MRYVDGYGGVAVLVQLLPAEWSGFMWRAMLVPRLAAAFSPVLLFWVARELDVGRGAALLAGVMLASIPVHAVLTSSDHLEGTMASLQLTALALVLAGRRRQRGHLFAAGVGFAAWAMWCRPEGVLGPFRLIAAAALISVCVAAWGCRHAGRLRALVAVRMLTLFSSPTIANERRPCVADERPVGQRSLQRSDSTCWRPYLRPLAALSAPRSGGVLPVSSPA
jgi:hypothetical protein